MNRFRARLLPIALLVLAPQMFAQTPRQVTSIDRRIETMNRQSREYERDNMGRVGKKSKVEAAKRTRQVRLEIEEDLKALQTAYNAIVVALQDGEPKPGFAAETAQSIAQRSERLKINLALPAVEDESETQKPIQIPEQERSALKLLGKAVYDFITNPIFEGTIALDVKESTRASRDLGSVIFISNAVGSR